MATIPRSLLKQLTDEVNALSGAGRQMVENALSRLVPLFADADGSVPAENVAALRAAACEVMEAVCGQVSDLAAARSAEFYDEVRALSVGERFGALVEAGRDPVATEGAVRALVRSVADTGSADRFARELGDRVDYEAKRAAAECVERNAMRDPLKPKWARVPSGAETCPFCIMLASRGFVYRSERSAGGAGHYHPNCDCRIVPGFDGDAVEGYDLDGLYRSYVDSLANGELKLKTVITRSTSHVKNWGSKRFESYGDFTSFINDAEDMEDLQLRCAFAEQEWAKTGLSDRYRSQLRQTVLNKRSSLMGDAFYEKPRAELEEHERKGVDHLLRNGIVPTVKQEDPRAKANIDFEIDGELWEMKNVTNDRGSVSNQIARIRKKWVKLELPDSPRGIITCEGCTASLDEVCGGVELRMKPGERFIVVYKDGELRNLS